MSEHSLRIIEQIRLRIRRAGRRITISELAFGLTALIAVVSLLWLAASIAEAGFWLATGVRTAVFWAVVITSSSLLLYYLGAPLLRYLGVLPGLDTVSVARRIGDRYPQVSDRIVNLLDLAEGRRSDSPDEFVDGAVRMLGSDVSDFEFERVETYERTRRAGSLALLPIAGLLIFIMAAPTVFMDASTRLWSPGVDFERPVSFALTVEPGSTEIIRGSTLDIVTQARGSEVPSSVVIEFRNTDEERSEEVRLTSEEAGVFHHAFVNVRRDMEYRIETDQIVTEWYAVSVIERPVVRGVQVALEYPGYTGLSPRTLDPNVGDISALPGTRVSLEVFHGGQNLTGAEVVFDGETSLELDLEESRASGDFTIVRDGTYQIHLRNDLDVSNENPITYQITTLSDEYPVVRLLEPDAAKTLSESLEELVHMQITDDYGFSRLRLYYRLSESRFGEAMNEPRYIELPIEDRRELDQRVTYDWKLHDTPGLNLAPGDIVEYYATVWDNDAVSGFKSSSSATHILRFPSLAERYEELQRGQDGIEDELHSLIRESRAVREQFESLRDELRRKEEADWEDERQLESLMSQQQSLEERVDQVSERMESIREQMRENNLVSPETLQMYEELQNVMEEIQSPELRDALEQLRQALNEMNMRQMQESFQSFEFNEEQYQKRLERTLELFKQMRMQQSMDELSRLADDLGAQQDHLADETEKTREESESGKLSEDEARQQAEELARQQEESRAELEALMERLDELRSEMDEVNRAPRDAMDELLDKLGEQDFSGQMERNLEQLRDMQLDDAQQGQQDMSEQFRQLSTDMSEMMEQMRGQQLQLNIAALRRALFDVLSLSYDQESLRAESRSSTSDSPRLREIAQNQVELSRGLTTVNDTLVSVAREIPQMSREIQRHSGQALREMDRALQHLTDRRAGQAGGHQTASMSHLNELALMLSELLDQLRNMDQDGMGGMSLEQMIEQLQQMSGDQQEINQQIQDLLNDIQGDRLTQDQQERLQQISAQQQALREQLEEMARTREAGRVLGDLERIADQMEETIRELEQRRVDRRMVERQQQILSRLLDAQRSLEIQGEEEERRARTGEQIERESPPELTPEDTEDRLRRDLIRALESGYAADYESLIRRYFELLQQQSE